MTTIILSDTHLTDFVRPAKLAFLSSVIESADRVIIAGDFWDSYLTSFDRFVTSGWKELFPLLAVRQTVYLYGNHDPKQAADERVSQFSAMQADSYQLSLSPLGWNPCLRQAGGGVKANREQSIELHIEHGHRIKRHLDAFIPRWSINSLTTRLAQLAQLLSLRLLGPERALRLLHARDNDVMRAWAATNLGSSQILVTGHTDYPEIDLRRRYICIGFIRYGLASYLKIEAGQLELVETTY